MELEQDVSALTSGIDPVVVNAIVKMPSQQLDLIVELVGKLRSAQRGA